jgi:hypothetical protein
MSMSSRAWSVAEWQCAMMLSMACLARYHIGLQGVGAGAGVGAVMMRGMLTGRTVDISMTVAQMGTATSLASRFTCTLTTFLALLCIEAPRGPEASQLPVACAPFTVPALFLCVSPREDHALCRRCTRPL